MQLDELTPADINVALKKKKMKAPYPKPTKKVLGNPSLWNNFKKWRVFLKKNGWKMLGEGSFSAVFGKPGLNYVIKVPFKRDRPWVNYAEYCRTHKSNPHIMKVSYIKTETSNHFFIAAIERLNKFPKVGGYDMSELIGDYTEDLVYTNNTVKLEIEEFIERVEEVEPANGKKIRAWCEKILFPQLPALSKTIREINSIGGLDLHSNNIMMRGNKIVIIDPWFNWGEQNSRASNCYSNDSW